MTDIHLRGPLSRARGVIARYPSPSERYIFEWTDISPRRIHMLGVRRALIVEWWAEGEFVSREHLKPWFGTAIHRADRVIEYSPD
jgi:hypothetical protein